MICFFPSLSVNMSCCPFFHLWPFVIKRIEKIKNRVKSDLETAIKITDSKHVEILSAIESADSKRKKMESAVQHIGLKHQKFRQVFAKQKRLRNIWVSLDRREDDLLNQKFRTIRALNEINPFSIDDDGVELFESSAELSFNQTPVISNFDYFQIFEGFDFSSIPISSLTTF